MSRTIIIRCTTLAAATVLALTACGGTDDAPAEERDGGAAAEQEAPAGDSGDTDAEADDAAASDGGGEEEAGDGAAGSSEESAVVEIGTEFTDEETGDVITIVSAVRHNPTEYYLASDNPDGEMIYLEVEVTAGDQFGGVISQQDFVLDDGGEEVNYASTADEELAAAGFENFEGASRRDGGGAGYIPIYVEQTDDTLSGAYVRPEMKILGEDATVPEFRGEFEIPAA